MRRITLDIETTNATVGGAFDPSTMNLTVACIHDTETDAFTSYTVEELPKLWPIFERADLLVGYNSDHFDIPILNRYYPGDLSKIRSLDLLAEIKNVLGRRIKLDSVAEGTLGKKKSGNGLDAIKWWNEGKKDKVIQYCIDDVRITKDIYEYALKNGHLKYRELGSLHEVKIDTKNWSAPQSGAVTYTLGF